MFTVVITEKGGAQRRMEFDKGEVTVGRVQGNDIILPKGNVSKRHSRIVLKDSRFIVVDLKSTNGTYVNGRKITSPLVVRGGDKIYVGDFILTIDGGLMAGEAPELLPAGPGATAPDQGPAPSPAPAQQYQTPAPFGEAHATPVRQESAAPAVAAPAVAASEPERRQAPVVPAPPPRSVPPPLMRPHGAMPVGEAAPLPRVMPPAPVHRDMTPAPARLPASPAPRVAVPLPTSAQAYSPAAMASPERSVSPRVGAPAVLHGPPLTTPATTPRLRGQPAPPTYHEPVSAAATQQAPQAPGRVDDVGPPAAPPSRVIDELRAVMSRLASSFDVACCDLAILGDGAHWERARGAAQAALQEMERGGELDARTDRESLLTAALQEAVGLGALEPLLADDTVREIVVEGPHSIVVDRGQGFRQAAGAFSSSQAVVTAGKRLLAHAGASPDDKMFREVRMPDGTRVLLVMPPVAAHGPIIEIRRVTGMPVLAEDLVTRGIASAEMIELLRAAVAARRNIVVSGPIGSGVTTVLSALAALVPDAERLVTVQAVPDLSISRKHVVTLCTGGASTITLRELVQRANRLRGDRLVVDDVCGEEARDVLVAMASRRDGTLVGLHAASAAAAIDHLEVLARLDGGSATSTAVRYLIAEAVNVVVQLGRVADGTSRIVSVTEVLCATDSAVETRDLFVWQDGFVRTPIQPRSFGT